MQFLTRHMSVKIRRNRRRGKIVNFDQLLVCCMPPCTVYGWWHLVKSTEVTAGLA